MSRLCLTFASCRYDRMEAIRAGEVVPEGIDLNTIAFASGREIFDRMVGGREFDVAELSASEFISLMGRGDCPFVALPVFPSRVFRHGYIFINAQADIRAPKDLEGKRVGRFTRRPRRSGRAAIWRTSLGSISIRSAGCRGRWKKPAPTGGRTRRRSRGRSASSKMRAGVRSARCSRVATSMP